MDKHTLDANVRSVEDVGSKMSPAQRADCADLIELTWHINQTPGIVTADLAKRLGWDVDYVCELLSRAQQHGLINNRTEG